MGNGRRPRELLTLTLPLPPRLLRPPASSPHPSAVRGPPSPSTFLPTCVPTDAACPKHRDCRKVSGVTVTRHGLQSETSAHHSGSWTTCPQCAEARRQDCSQKAPAPLTCHPLSSRTPSRTIHFRCQRPTCVHKLGAIADSGSPDSATPASLLSLSFPILPQWRFLDSAAPPCVRPRLLLSPPLLIPRSWTKCLA